MKTLITLDIWNTLITFNHDVRVPRTKIISDILNISESSADSAYQHFKYSADSAAESGSCLTQEELYTQFIEHTNSSRGVSWKVLRGAVEKNFEQYPPYMHPQLISVLKKLHMDGYTLAIASNNNFIGSETMNRSVVQHLGVPFAFVMYSTDCGMAKPGKDFMKLYKKNCFIHGFKADDVFHVGDNPICDNFGKYVKESIIIKNPSDFIKTMSVFE